MGICRVPTVLHIDASQTQVLMSPCHRQNCLEVSYPIPPHESPEEDDAMDTSPPQNPVGPFASSDEYDESIKHDLIKIVQQTPTKLRDAVAGLSDSQLDTRYKNWSIRQIVHHIADSHVHSYIRFRWSLTEDNPTIKAYEEADWVQLADCRQGDIEPSLALLEGLHAKWVQMLKVMSSEQFARTFVHPQSGETITLWTALNYYPWHARHHTGQITWLRDHHDW